MRKVWDIRLYAFDNQVKSARYRVEIRDPQGRVTTGEGLRPHEAYRSCESRMVVKPGFHIPPDPVSPEHT